MLNKKEIFSILIITLVLAFAISLLQSFNLFLYSALSVLIILIINTFAKKIAGFYLDTDIEIKLWEIKKWGFRAHHHFKKQFQIGAFLPIITTILSVGHIIWMACLNFEVKPKIYKAAKRHGLYSFTEMTEYHLGLIAAAGIVANLIFAIIGYLIGLPEAMNFVQLSILFAFYNMIPISDLDGNKIFFGSLILWSFLASIVVIGLLYVLFII